MGRVNVIHIACKFVGKIGVEDELGKVTLKKSANRISVETNELGIVRLLSSSGASSKRK